MQYPTDGTAPAGAVVAGKASGNDTQRCQLADGANYDLRFRTPVGIHLTRQKASSSDWWLYAVDRDCHSVVRLKVSNSGATSGTASDVGVEIVAGQDYVAAQFSGIPGSDQHSLRHPSGLYVLPGRAVFVADSGNHRVA